MLPEYDFSDAEQGKFFKHFANEVRVDILDADVARSFSDSKEVNDLLRAHIPRPEPVAQEK